MINLAHQHLHRLVCEPISMNGLYSSPRLSSLTSQDAQHADGRYDRALKVRAAPTLQRRDIFFRM